MKISSFLPGAARILIKHDGHLQKFAVLGEGLIHARRRPLQRQHRRRHITKPVAVTSLNSQRGARGKRAIVIVIACDPCSCDVWVLKNLYGKDNNEETILLSGCPAFSKLFLRQVSASNEEAIIALRIAEHAPLQICSAGSSMSQVLSVSHCQAMPVSRTVGDDNE